MTEPSQESSTSCTVEEITGEDQPAAGPLGDVPLTAPSDCQQVTPDGGVLKRVLVEGTGEPPGLHARVLVHYVGKLLPGGDVFMDTKADSQAQEPARLVAGRDSVTREAGLNLAVATMRRGERAAVYITDPQYGFGTEGSFSFPCVPPNAQLVYDVAVLDWEEAEEAEDRRGMLYEERLEAAERRRRDGNDLFAKGQYEAALGKYALALSYMDEDFLMQLEGFHLDKAHATLVPTHLNIAAAHIRLGDNHAAVFSCSQALQYEPDNTKALFRRGKARGVLGQTQEALADMEAAYKGAPKDKAVVRELHALRQALKEERKASAKFFKGTLGSAPPATAAIRQQQQQEMQQGQRRDNTLGRLLSRLCALFESILQGIRSMLLPASVPAKAHAT